MNERYTHIDLFSGIGGFSLAAERCGFRTVAFIEKEPFCQEVLKLRFGAVADAEGSGWRNNRIAGELGSEKKEKGEGGDKPSSTIGDSASASRPLLIPDIRDFDGSLFRGATLLTGGFPCQPFSTAGKRRGKADDRFLWPEMLRVIRESRPRWAIAENVPGPVSIGDGLVFEQVLADLEAEGYEVWPFIIPACGVNAPHRRDRVWIIAHCNNGGQSSCLRETISGRQSLPIPNSEPSGRNRGGCGIYRQNSPDSDAPDADRNGLQKPGAEQQAGRDRPDDQTPAHTESGKSGEPKAGNGGKDTGGGSEAWNLPWLEVATRFCRVSYGFSDWVHGYITEIIGGDDSYATSINKNRTKGLSALREAVQQEEIWGKRGSVG